MGNCTSQRQNDLLLQKIAADLKQLKEQGAEFKAGQEEFKAGQAELKAELHSLSADVKKLDTVVNLPMVNPWYHMAVTERSRAKNLRSQFLNAHKNIDPSFDIDKCWLTGESNTKVAHIIPDSAQPIVLDKLSLSPEFKNGLSKPPYNFLLLTTPVEEAFDHQVCSFIPVDLLHPSTFKLCVWNEAKAAKIPVGTKTLLDYHDSQLNIPPYWVVSRRSLSYHALCAYYNYQADQASKPNGGPAPSDFSSVHDQREATREWLISFLQTSVREEKQEEEDNKEEENQEEEDNKDSKEDET